MRRKWIHIALAVILALLVLFWIRMHVAAAQPIKGNPESGMMYAMNWCTECHSVQPETAGTGNFAPDFSAVAKRRGVSARLLNAFLRSEHKIMPDFALKPDEADDIVAYILSLRNR